MGMNFNIFGLLATLIPMLIRFVAIFVLVVYCIIKLVRILGGESFLGRKKAVILSIVYIFIAAISWVFNMGWLRFFLTIIFVPVIHAIAFLTVNLYSAKYFETSRNIKTLNLFFVITYLMLYLLLPDGGDYGGLYFFFGLIRDDVLAVIASCVSSLAFTAHAILLIMQLLEIRRINKSIKQKEGIQK